MNAHKLAKLLATEDGLAAVRSLQSLGILGGGEPADDGPTGPQAILDWKPVLRGDELTFERTEFYRCKPKVIRAKAAGTTRVCLFGESMAAGFPLAPAYSPAIALEQLVRSAVGNSTAVEVIDLSMPNMGPSEQLRVCEAARQLVPDVFVFLTGNNWYYGLAVEPTASPEARVNYASQIADDGAAALSAGFRKKLEARARVMLGVQVAAARAVGARAIVVVPAVNHDWERRTSPPWLGGGNTARWFDCLAAAERSLAKGDLDGALRAATQLDQFEGGLSATGQRLAVRAHRAAGRVLEARDAALRAVDASNWHNYSWALPQVPTYVADVMRSSAAELGYECVDLGAVFAKHTGSPFLDFRMLFDHCHLTGEGIQVAMSAVARCIAGRAGETQAIIATAPSELTAASAAFQAAHWLSQFGPVVDTVELNEKLCALLRRAVDADDHLLIVMTDYLRLRSLACAPTLHAALPAAVRVPGVAAALVSRRLNAPLVTAIVDVLRERAVVGVDAVVDELIQSHVAVLAAGLDISHPWFCEWFWERTPLAWNDPNDRQGAPYYRAAWPESRFAFLTDATGDLVIELVARSASMAPVAIFVNEVAVGTCELGVDWRRWRGSVARAHLRHGVNRVRLQWPALAIDDDQALARAMRRFELGADADLFPVFGEVYSFTLRAASAATQPNARI